MNKNLGNKDTVLPFFLAWLLSVLFFILLISTTNESNNYTDFETIVLFGSMGFGSVAYLIALILAVRQKLNYYVWSLGVGFVLFFYVLFQMAN
jgi:hypothetical protein